MIKTRMAANNSNRNNNNDNSAMVGPVNSTGDSVGAAAGTTAGAAGTTAGAANSAEAPVGAASSAGKLVGAANTPVALPEIGLKPNNPKPSLQSKDYESVGVRGCEVYVTRIPRESQENQIRQIFSRIGEVTNLRLMMEPTGQNRGYAYIRYSSPQEAKEAIRKLNNYEINPNRYLVVTKSVDNRRLWVNGIPKSKSIAEIRADMERMTAGVKDIILYPSQMDKNKSRGYMFVEYESHKAAALARRKMTQGAVTLCGQEVGQVDWAEPETEVEEEVMATVRILFVRKLMVQTSEDDLRRIFNERGNNEVERVKKTKDFAFIHFSSRAAAEKALNSCRRDPAPFLGTTNNSSNNGSNNNNYSKNNSSHSSGCLSIDGAEVEVLWSKPVDKKLYNTRKALTKAFTLGSELVDNESGRLETVLPRRRGAAGIRGLGAPGTPPSKQLVQRYCNTANSAVVVVAAGGGGSTGGGGGGCGSSSSSSCSLAGGGGGVQQHHHHHQQLVVGGPGHMAQPGPFGYKNGVGLMAPTPLFKSAPDLLLDICHHNRWGEPVYTLTTLGEAGRSFLYRITLPQFPHPPPHNSFQPYCWRSSQEEARLEAAQFVLACLRITPEYVCSLSSVPQMYPMTPGALQGIPLTVSTGAGGGGGAGNQAIYNRILQQDPYTAAYTSLLSSMYAMNVNV